MTDLGASCLFCGTRGAAGAPCGTCAMTIPGEMDEPGEASLEGCKCPRCSAEMKRIDDVRVCPKCHGMFVPSKAWHVLFGDAERASSIEATYATKPAPPGSLFELVSCPSCRREMERARFATHSDVVIDVCTMRHGVWLDSGELRAVLDFFRRREEVGEERLRAEAAASEKVADRALQDAVHSTMGRSVFGAAATSKSDAAEKPSSAKVIGFVVLAVLSVGGLFAGRACLVDGPNEEPPPPSPTVPTASAPKR